MEENRGKSGGFLSSEKEWRMSVWNEGSVGSISGGTAPKAVLLEETKNELRSRALAMLTCVLQFFPFVA
jgi:hypothetical protein